MHWLLLIVLLSTQFGCSTISKRSIAAEDPLKLNWNLSQASPEIKTLLLKTAERDLAADPPLVAVEVIQKEGTLNSDPRHSSADDALKNVNLILNWAICSTIADQPLRGQCADKAAKGIIRWADTYKPSGNPINDVQLLRLIVATDLVSAYLKPQSRTTILNWLRLFITSGDEFFANLKANDRKKLNNWMTWRLAIRGLAAVVLDDQNFIRSTKALIQDHSRLNLSSQGWQPPSDCINSDERYGGLDFRTRDALHYHVYNLEAWTWILRFAPELIDEQTLARIKEAFDFLHPYYLGQRTHIEFACTTVKFDILRKNEGQDQFQNKNWIKTGVHWAKCLADNSERKFETWELIQYNY
jgi:hypothetical protein